MCGRYYRHSDKQHIASALRAEVRFPIAASYNIAPQSTQPVVRINDETGKREAVLMRWGLLPSFARTAKPDYSTINARSETACTAATYRGPMKNQRCLVPANGFFEWRKVDAKNKQAFAITLRDAEILAFAGLWDAWKDSATGTVVESFTILTTEANELMLGEQIHTRMPVILDTKDYDRWLQPGLPERLPTDLLRPYASEAMRCWKIGRAVGSVRNDSPELLKPDTDETPVPQSLFAFNSDESP